MKVLAITGGVGGAKLAVGLARQFGPDELMFAVNTGDDFQHLGLNISPDIDSLTYALAGENNDELGWGRAGETWSFIQSLGALGGADWFRLGDKDLALHMRRTELLANGASLSEATATIGQAMGIRHTMAPMSDDPVPTIVHTEQGDLPFQHYFVRERCAPRVQGFTFQGIEQATLNPQIDAWLGECDGVIICPSNPYVSVDPMLSLSGMRARLEQLPVVAVSPIVGGIALKGPAAKMMQELQVPTTPAAVAAHYGDLLNGFIVDATDEAATDGGATLSQQIEQARGIKTIATQTIMRSLDDRVALAQDALDLLASL